MGVEAKATRWSEVTFQVRPMVLGEPTKGMVNKTQRSSAKISIYCSGIFVLKVGNRQFLVDDLTRLFERSDQVVSLDKLVKREEEYDS